MGPEKVDHLMKRHIRYQVTAHNKDVSLERKFGDKNVTVKQSFIYYGVKYDCMSQTNNKTV